MVQRFHNINIDRIWSSCLSRRCSPYNTVFSISLSNKIFVFHDFKYFKQNYLTGLINSIIISWKPDVSNTFLFFERFTSLWLHQVSIPIYCTRQTTTKILKTISYYYTFHALSRSVVVRGNRASNSASKYYSGPLLLFTWPPPLNTIKKNLVHTLKNLKNLYLFDLKETT